MVTGMVRMVGKSAKVQHGRDESLKEIDNKKLMVRGVVRSDGNRVVRMDGNRQRV